MVSFIGGLLVLFLFGTSLCVIGHSLARRIFTTNSGALGAIFIGLTSISSAASLIYCFTDIRVDYAFILLTLIGVGIAVRIDPKAARQWIKPAVSKEGSLSIASGMGVIILMLWPVASNIQSISDNGGVLLAHIDLFTHAATINQLAMQGEIGKTQLLSYGDPAAIYHYGMYIFPAMLVQYVDWRALDVLVYLVLPFGILVTWTLLIQIARQIAGSAGFSPIVAAIVALVAADASRAVVFSNNLVDLPYLLAASPGAIYGLNIILYFVKAYLYREKVTVPAVTFGVFLLLGFRVLYIPLFVIFSVLAYVVFLKRATAPKVLAVLITVLLCIATQSYLNGPIVDYYSFMQTFCAPNPCTDSPFASPALLGVEIIAATLGGTLLILAGVLGAFLIGGRSRRLSSTPLLLLISMIVAYYCAIMLAFTPGNGDITEFLHRPFVVVNLVSAILIMGMLCNYIIGRYVVHLLSIALLAHLIGASREFGFPADHDWHKLSYRVPVEKEIIEISQWLKSSAIRQPYVVLPMMPNSFSVYPEAVITSLSKTPAFVSRLGHYINNTSDKRPTQQKIDAVNKKLSCTGTDREANFYIISAEPLKPCHQRVAQFGKYAVYR
jgi:hypothetical protein